MHKPVSDTDNTRSITLTGLNGREVCHCAMILQAGARRQGERLHIHVCSPACRRLPPRLILTRARTRCEIPFDQIISISTDGHGLLITCLRLEQKFRVSLNSVREQILQSGDTRFLQPNRGILLNMDHIRYIRDGNIVMDNGSSFAVRVRYPNKITEQYNAYLLRKQ